MQCLLRGGYLARACNACFAAATWHALEHHAEDARGFKLLSLLDQL